MSASPQLRYEPQPAGGALIDQDDGTVFIRLYPDRRLGRLLGWLFAILGVAVLLIAIATLRLTPAGLFRAVPPLSAAGLLLVSALVIRNSAGRGVTTILATSEGIEYTASGFAARTFARSTIQRIFTRDTPITRSQLSICLHLQDGTDIVLGSGQKTDIDAMARALHRVLNAPAKPEVSQHDA